MNSRKIPKLKTQKTSNWKWKTKTLDLNFSTQPPNYKISKLKFKVYNLNYNSSLKIKRFTRMKSKNWKSKLKFKTKYFKMKVKEVWLKQFPWIMILNRLRVCPRVSGVHRISHASTFRLNLFKKRHWLKIKSLSIKKKFKVMGKIKIRLEI